MLLEINENPLSSVEPYEGDSEGDQVLITFGDRVYTWWAGDKFKNRLAALTAQETGPYHTYEVGDLIRSLRSRNPIRVQVGDDFVLERDWDEAEIRRMWLEDLKELETWLASQAKAEVRATNAAEYLRRSDY